MSEDNQDFVHWMVQSAGLPAAFALLAKGEKTEEDYNHAVRTLAAPLLLNPLCLFAAKDWNTFFGKFSMPDNLAERFLSNLSLYSANYINLSFFLVFAGGVAGGGWTHRIYFLQLGGSHFLPEVDLHPKDKLFYLSFLNFLSWTSFLLDLSSSKIMQVFCVFSVALHAAFRARGAMQYFSDKIKKI